MRRFQNHNFRNSGQCSYLTTGTCFCFGDCPYSRYSGMFGWCTNFEEVEVMRNNDFPFMDIGAGPEQQAHYYDMNHAEHARAGGYSDIHQPRYFRPGMGIEEIIWQIEQEREERHARAVQNVLQGTPATPAPSLMWPPPFPCTRGPVPPERFTRTSPPSTPQQPPVVLSSSSSALSGQTDRQTLPSFNGPRVEFETLQKNLECPVCLNTFKIPVIQCSKGHSVCSSCKNKLRTCPQCRTSMTAANCVRNYALEAVLNDMVVHCKFRDQGCPLRVKYFDLSEHSKKCFFRLIKCKQSLECTENRVCVPFIKYMDHLFETHNPHQNGRGVLPKVGFSSGNRMSALILDFCFREAFMMKFVYHQDYFGFFVAHIGLDEQDAHKYTCEVIIGHPENETLRHKFTIVQVYSLGEIEKDDPWSCAIKVPKNLVFPLVQERANDYVFHLAIHISRKPDIGFHC